MPITKPAKKALRSTKVKKARNDRNKKIVKESIKKVEKMIKEKNKEGAKKLLSEAYSAIDKAAKRGILKKNTAARRKAKLSKDSK